MATAEISTNERGAYHEIQGLWQSYNEWIEGGFDQMRQPVVRLHPIFHNLDEVHLGDHSGHTT